MDPDERNERGTIAEMPDFLGMRDVTDVEDVHPGAPVGQKDFVADDERRSMQYGARRRRRCFALSLPLHPPAPDFHRTSRVADVDDEVDVIFEPRHFGGEMQVLAARIPIPMCT